MLLHIETCTPLCFYHSLQCTVLQSSSVAATIGVDRGWFATTTAARQAIVDLAQS